MRIKGDKSHEGFGKVPGTQKTLLSEGELPVPPPIWGGGTE